MLKPAFGAHLDHIAKPFGGDQSGFRPAPFDQRVGGQGRSVNDLTNVSGRDPRLGADLMHPIDDRVFGCAVGCENLDRMLHLPLLQYDIGEGSANIDPHTHCTGFHIALQIGPVSIGLEGTSAIQKSNQLIFSG